MANVIIHQNKYYFPQDVEHLVKYCFDPDKTTSDLPRLNHYIGLSPDIVDVQAPGRNQRTAGLFLFNHSFWDISSGSFVRHVIVSFAAEELTDPYTAWRIGEQISQWYFSCGYVNCFGVHTNTDNLHVHIVVDNTSYVNGGSFFIFDESNILRAKVDTWLADITADKKMHDKQKLS